MKSVLIYVLSAALEPYTSLFKASLGTWDSQPLEGTQTHYYFGQGQRPKHDRATTFPVPESYNTMSAKNLHAFQWALDNLSWDYMARVNASCYVRKPLLLKAVQELPESGVFRGVGAGAFVWGGAQFIFSRDVVQRMMAEKHKCDVSLMDDVSISKWVEAVGIPWDTKGHGCSINRQPDGYLCIWYADGLQGGMHFKDFKELHSLDAQYFYRVKQDLRRQEDIKIMQTLHRCGL